MNVIESRDLHLGDLFRTGLQGPTVVYRCVAVPGPLSGGWIGEAWCVHGGDDGPVVIGPGRTVFVLSNSDRETHRTDRYHNPQGLL